MVYVLCVFQADERLKDSSLRNFSVTYLNGMRKRLQINVCQHTSRNTERTFSVFPNLDCYFFRISSVFPYQGGGGQTYRTPSLSNICSHREEPTKRLCMFLHVQKPVTKYKEMFFVLFFCCFVFIIKQEIFSWNGEPLFCSVLKT